jgi:hypothetical protein
LLRREIAREVARRREEPQFTDWIGNDITIDLDLFPQNYIYSRQNDGVVWYTIASALAIGGESGGATPTAHQFMAEMASVRRRRKWLLRMTQRICHMLSYFGLPRDITKLIATYVLELPDPEKCLVEPFCDMCSNGIGMGAEDFGSETKCGDCNRDYCFVAGCSSKAHPDPDRHRHFQWMSRYDPSAPDNSNSDE